MAVASCDDDGLQAVELSLNRPFPFREGSYVAEQLRDLPRGPAIATLVSGNEE
ncbi:hypothetical protein D3C85_1603820 [compost metagenome]